MPEDGIEVVGAAVLVEKVVGVFPNVDAEEGVLPVHEGAILIGGGGDGEGSVGLGDEPGPSAAEDAEAGLLEVGEEGVEGSEVAEDDFAQSAFGFCGFRGENVPEEGVVVMATAVVADNLLHGAGEVADAGEKGFEGPELVGGMLAEGGVEGVDVGLMMTLVVDHHGLGINGGLEGVVGIR